LTFIVLLLLVVLVVSIAKVPSHVKCKCHRLFRRR